MIDQMIDKIGHIAIGAGAIGATVMFIITIVKEIIESLKGE